MTRRTCSCSILVQLAVVLGFSSAAFAQSCIEDCSAALYSVRSSCEAVYQTCIANAAGDPALIAVCEQQRAACRDAADAAFRTCAGHCTSDPCVMSCAIAYGTSTAFCRDAYAACLMLGIPEPQCRAQQDACFAGAAQRYNGCVLGCAVPIGVAPIDWGHVKRLCRD